MMKKLMVIGLVALVAAVQAFTPASNVEAGTSEDVRKISLAELQSFMKEKDDLVVLDARGGWSFNGVVIEGAGNLPAKSVSAESLAEAIPSKDTPVVFYCSGVNCAAGEIAARKAIGHGYTDVYDFKGGIAEWAEAGLPTNKLK